MAEMKRWCCCRDMDAVSCYRNRNKAEPGDGDHFLEDACVCVCHAENREDEHDKEDAMGDNVEDRLRELEWAATYVKTHPPRRCRCGGSCEECRELSRAVKKINASSMLELLALARPSGKPNVAELSPSLGTRFPGRPGYYCHSYVTDGRIKFLADSTHKLAGQEVELPAWPFPKAASS